MGRIYSTSERASLSFKISATPTIMHVMYTPTATTTQARMHAYIYIYTYAYATHALDIYKQPDFRNRRGVRTVL